MKWFKVFSARIRALLKREAVIQDIDEEFNVHVDMQTDANIQRGMSATEARAAAIRSFGNLGRIKDVAYEIRLISFLSSSSICQEYVADKLVRL